MKYHNNQKKECTIKLTLVFSTVLFVAFFELNFSRIFLKKSSENPTGKSGFRGTRGIVSSKTVINDINK